MPKHKERPTPKVGTRYEKRFKGKDHILHVVENEGRVCYKLGREIFASPTAAAKSLTKSEINGWKFWQMD